jgi:nucleoside-triphosphatase THEP1
MMTTMNTLTPLRPVTAIIYSEGRKVDPVMSHIATGLRQRGYALAGFVQRDAPRPGRRRCDMMLEDLASGTEIAISEDRGAMARGCHLDVSELLRGTALARQALDAGADLLIINKFGKTEGEGGGFRPLIAEALMRGTPVLIAVPWRNIDGWRLFAGDLGEEIVLDGRPDQGQAICAMLAARLGHDGTGDEERNSIAFPPQAIGDHAG